MEYVNERIMIGNSSDARKPDFIKNTGITAMLNVAGDLGISGKDRRKGLAIYKRGLTAGPGNTLEELASAVRMLEWLLYYHERVLVFCHSAKDRSPLVVACYLAIKGEDFDEVLKHMEKDLKRHHKALYSLGRDFIDKFGHSLRDTETDKTVYAFDRDGTVDVNKGAVPLDWVKHLARANNNEVWAIGNQALKEEANIPGVKEAQERLFLDTETMPKRRDRIRMLKNLFPKAKEYIVIDDEDLSDLEVEGWQYYSPESFYDKYKERMQATIENLPRSDLRVFMLSSHATYNCGDQLTNLGSKYLLQKAFGNVEFLEFDISRAVREIDTYVPEYNWGKADIIVVPGAPWISNKIGDKGRILKQAIERWPNALRVGLGIGSFFSYGALKDPEEKIFNDKPSFTGQVESSVEPFKEFDVLFVRDKLAQEVFQYFGIKSNYYYDTSIFAKHYFKRVIDNSDRNQNILVFYDPSLFDARTHLPEEHWDRIIQFQQAWALKNEARCFCISSGDKSTADKIGLDCRFVTDLSWLAGEYSRAKRVLSGRVHQGIFAKVCKVPQVSIIPVDSRYLTGVKCGIQIEQPKSEYEFEVSEYPIVDLSKVDEEIIINTLREAFE